MQGLNWVLCRSVFARQPTRSQRVHNCARTTWTCQNTQTALGIVETKHLVDVMRASHHNQPEPIGVRLKRGCCCCLPIQLQSNSRLGPGMERARGSQHCCWGVACGQADQRCSCSCCPDLQNNRCSAARPCAVPKQLMAAAPPAWPQQQQQQQPGVPRRQDGRVCVWAGHTGVAQAGL